MVFIALGVAVAALAGMDYMVGRCSLKPAEPHRVESALAS